LDQLTATDDCDCFLGVAQLKYDIDRRRCADVDFDIGDLRLLKA
jgi:hypothetical protein